MVRRPTVKLRGSNLARAQQISSSAKEGSKSKTRPRSVADVVHAPPRDVDIAKDAGLAFLDADINGDQQLSWDEFYLCIPASIKSRSSMDELKDLFESVDTDGSGFISIDEYFMWSINICVNQNGRGLEPIFRRYDQNGTGTLDANEFAQICTDINFGMYAHDIFVELVSARDLQSQRTRPLIHVHPSEARKRRMV